MKKLICMILVLVMTMSLAACGAGADDTDDKKGEPSGMKETSATVTEETAIAEPEVTAEVEMWLERIPGEYLGFNITNGTPKFPGFTLNADKTCTFGDQSYTWGILVNKLDYIYKCDEDYAEVLIRDGETTVYKLHLTLHEEDYISASLYTGSSSNHDTYYNMTDIEVVDITLDNWDNYFGGLERITTTKDPFGEVTTMRIYNYIVLKEALGSAIAPISNVIVEYSCVKETREITVDLENLTYKWGEAIYTNPAFIFTFAMCNQTFEETGEDHYGFLPYISYTQVDKFPEDQATAFTDVEVLRITGTLYYVPAK